MTHHTDHNTTDHLDALLRDWHDQNAASARDNRDALMSRLAREDKAVVARIGDDEDASAITTRRPFWARTAAWTPVAASLAIMVSLMVAMMGAPGGKSDPRINNLADNTPAQQETMSALGAGGAIRQASFVPGGGGGRLDVVDNEGQIVGTCPLQHTDVTASIQGKFARVAVKQHYANPFTDKIEAVYTFPLSNDAAVDRMTMTIGDRVIVGEVKERTVARNIYEQARAQGRAAALLEQERPNIFTQSVANIEPGAQITIEITYLELIHSSEGQYTFSFPMTLAPRYIPGYAVAAHDAAGARNEQAGIDWDAVPDGHGLEEVIRNAERNAAKPTPGAPFAHDTEQVPDASRITPTPTRPEVRAGHDIAIEVNLQTGGPGIVELHSVQHEIDKTDLIKPNDFTAPVGALIHLKNKNTIPNKDFVLKWRLADESIENQVFSYNGNEGGFLTISMLPPARTPLAETRAVPRELVFVLDTSGSMNGFPIEKAKAVMTRAISQMRGGDTFNIITFAGATRILWDEPKPATPENIAAANAFVANQYGHGGTEMMAAINAALAQTTHKPKRNWITPNEFNHLYKHGDPVTLRLRMTGREYLAIEGHQTFEIPIADGETLTASIQYWTLELGFIDPDSIVTLELKGRYLDDIRDMPEFVVDHTELVPNDFIPAEALLNLPADGRRVELLINSFTSAHDPLFQGEGQEPMPLSKWIADLRMRARIIESEFRKATIVGRWTTQNAQRVFVMDQWGGADIEPARPVRICMFLTDGQVGNDHAIIDAVQNNAGTTRVFSFGVGSAPNRYLLDGIALAGRGAADYVPLNENGGGADPIVDRFTTRIQTPLLSDVSIEFNTPVPILDVVSPNVLGELQHPEGRNDIYLFPDLYDRAPITLHARFNHAANTALTGTAVVRGRTAQGPFERVIQLNFPAPAPAGALAHQQSILPTLWAREKVNQLLATDLSGLQLGTPKGDVRTQVITLGETFSIMTPFTSFVAVDRARVTIAGQPRLVHVPVELPEGQSYEGIFGQASRGIAIRYANQSVPASGWVAQPESDNLGIIPVQQGSDSLTALAISEGGGSFPAGALDQLGTTIYTIDPNTGLPVGLEDFAFLAGSNSTTIRDSSVTGGRLEFEWEALSKQPALGEIPLAPGTLTTRGTTGTPEPAAPVRVSPQSAQTRDRFDAVPELDLDAVLELSFYDLAGDGMQDEAASIFAESDSSEADASERGLGRRELTAKSQPVDTTPAPPTDAASPTTTTQPEPTDADNQRAQLLRTAAIYAHLARVLHPALQQALASALQEAGIVQAGRDAQPRGEEIRVTVLLANTDEATIKALYDAGLKVEATNHNLSLAVGRISPERLLNLALTPPVRRVEPLTAHD